MTKILLIASIALSMGAAALGYLNRDKLKNAQLEVENATSTLATTQEKLQSAAKELETTKISIGTEKDQLTSQLTEATTALEKSKVDLTTASDKATTLEAEVTGMKADAEAKDLKIAGLEQAAAGATTAAATSGPPSGQAAPSGAEGGSSPEMASAERDEARTLLAAAQDENTALKAQIAALQGKEKSRQTSQMRQGLQGTILAVNQAWNFVILSIGDRQGVVTNAEMLVQRGGQLLGKIRVTSVEPSTSVADILVRTVPRGFTVMPGDTVIYQAKRD